MYLTSKLYNGSPLALNKAEEDYIDKNKLLSIITDSMLVFLLVLAFLMMNQDLTTSLVLGVTMGAVYVLAREYARGRSGGHLNVASRIGQAIVSKNYKHLFIYMIGPLCGSLIAACVYSVYKEKIPTIFGSCFSSPSVQEIPV